MDGGCVRYLAKGQQLWVFPIDALLLVAEWTDQSGPWGDDYMYFFCAGHPPKFFEAPMYANPNALDALSQALGLTLRPGLANSADFNSRVIWPTEYEGHPLFRYTPLKRGAGILNRVRDAVLPLVRSELTDELAAYLRLRTDVE